MEGYLWLCMHLGSWLLFHSLPSEIADGGEGTEAGQERCKSPHIGKVNSEAFPKTLG